MSFGRSFQARTVEGKELENKLVCTLYILNSTSIPKVICSCVLYEGWFNVR